MIKATRIMCVYILDTIPKLHIVDPVSSKPKGSNLQDIKRLEGIEQKEKMQGR